jgi:hypothetical protein
MKLMENRWVHNAADPLENVWFAADYLNHTLHKQYKGNIVAAIADYNGGWTQAKNVLKNKMPTDKQTADYLKKAEYHASVFDSEEQPEIAAKPSDTQLAAVEEPPAQAPTPVEQPNLEQTAMP